MTKAEELRNIFWAEDAKNGYVIRRQYDEIKKVLREYDFNWAQEQYKKIRIHAIQNTEFYKGYKVDETFPIVSKISILDNYDAHKAKGEFDMPIHISSTSGSTGTPFSVEQNYTKRNRVIAELKVYGELAEYPSHERLIFYRALSKMMGRSREQEDAENIYYVDCSDLSDDGLAVMLNVLFEKKPQTIIGYSTVIVLFAKYCGERIKVVDFSFLKSIIVGGEGLSENDNQFLQRVFGCNVYRRYSDMELGILGQDDGNSGFYQLNWGSYYFECLKLDSDESANDGEVGRIVITDLFNYALPMIRYDTGDLGVMIYPKDGTLPYFKEIFGRCVDNVFSVDGRLITQHAITRTLLGINGILQWQFVQESVNRYVLRVVSKEDYLEKRLKENVVDYIVKLKDILGKDANIEVEYINEIPVLSSGKRRVVVCNLR